MNAAEPAPRSQLGIGVGIGTPLDALARNVRRGGADLAVLITPAGASLTVSAAAGNQLDGREDGDGRTPSCGGRDDGRAAR